MDTNKMRPVTDATNIEATGWKSREHRNMTVNKIVEFLIKHGHPTWTQNLLALTRFVERFEEKVFASTKDEAEYHARISAKLETARAPLESAESTLFPSNSTGSGAERETNIEWQEQVYQKVQTIKDTYFTRLNAIYKHISTKLQQHELVPQQPMTTEMEKCEQHKRILEHIFALLKVPKSHITPDFKQRLDKAEKYIHTIMQPKNVSSHQQEQHSANVQSMQQFAPSLQSSQQNSQPNKMHLQDHQVANQFRSSQPQANQVSIKQVSGYGNVVQQQTSGEIKSSEAFIINNPGISTPPSLEDCRVVNESDISDDPSAAMQRLIKVLNSISTEGLIASCAEIGAVVHLNDDSSTLELLNEPPNSAIGTNLEGVAVSDSQARYLTYNDFVTKGRKMSRFINSMPTSESFEQLTSEKKPCSNSATTQENYNALSKEIEEINNRLIDTEVIIGEEKTFPGAVEGATKHGEGLFVKLVFNAISVNVNPMSEYSYSKKSIIKTLWLHVPTSYPHCSPVIVDEMSSEIRSTSSLFNLNSKDQEDLSMKAKLKLRQSLLGQSQPLSLRDIAKSWDRCAREAICEYAQLQGGGTFTSKHGGWETCPNDS